MTNNEQLYQSILQQLSRLPLGYLPKVNQLLKRITKDVERKSSNRAKIMAFAGAWEDMEEHDFLDYLKEAKETNIEIDKDILW